MLINEYIRPPLKCEVFHFGIDTIRFNFDKNFKGEFFRSLFHGLSLNSNQNFRINFFGIEVMGAFSQTNSKKILQLFYGEDNLLCIEQTYGDSPVSKGS